MKRISFLIIFLLTMILNLSASILNSEEDEVVVFYFVRHGKTMFNTMERAQGWSDTPLTKKGEEVAEYLGNGLKDIQFRSAYSSDLGRARQTARIVLDSKGQEDMQIIEIKDIRETNFGSYEGEPGIKMVRDAALYSHYVDLDEFVKSPEFISMWLSGAKALDTLGVAEDYEDVKARGQKAIKKIAEIEAKKGSGNVLIVGHGMSIGIFLSDIDSFGKHPSKDHMDNAAVCKVTYKNGEFTLESFGDMSYVEAGKASIKENK